jgi:type I restriction enzyme S subunit
MNQYPQHRSSSIGLIPKIPSHWGENTIKRGFEVSLGKMLQGERKLDTELLAPYLRSANVQWGNVDVTDIQEMWFSPSETIQLTLEPGDLVACEGGDAGRAAIWQGEITGCYFQNSVNRVRSYGGHSTHFLMYWLSALKVGGFVDIICNKATIAHLTKEKLANLPMVYPPLEEQYAIAAYLDSETKRIDELIDGKLQLKSLLQELKRNTVTKGIHEGMDKEVDMKESGTSWFSEIPMHWRAMRLKRVIDSIENGWSPQCEGEPADVGQWGVLKAGACNGGVFKVAENKALPANETPRPDLEIKLGNVLMSRASGSLDLVGSVAYVDEVQPGLMLSDKIFRLNIDEELVSGEWLALALNSTPMRRQIASFVGGAEGLARNIASSAIRELILPFPPLEEQVAIVKTVKLDLARIAELVLHVDSELAMLNELRSATITDAVLGRIDIRKAQAH